MKRTFITTMPDHIGAFLKASRVLASLGINITRVSYNKAVDSHTLFIDAEGDRKSLEKADKQLTRIGYLKTEKHDESIVLLEFRLKDEPGSVTEVLRLIDRFHFNISYISSQENGTEYQFFKMGLFVEDNAKISEFLQEAEKLCRVRVIDYNRSEKVFDNSIFYNSFVSGLARRLDLFEDVKQDLIVNANLAMQTLDEKGLSPYKTFDSISRFADLLAKYRGERFSPRITRHPISGEDEILLVEPACGSNTILVKSAGKVLFIDSGYAIYRKEMLTLFRGLLPGFDKMEKKILITHADVDHAGLLPLFDQVLASKRTAQCLKLEYEGKDGFREQNPRHLPYIKMCKILTEYEPVSPHKVQGLWNRDANTTEPLEKVGKLDWGNLHFEVYEGLGGHLKGEIVLIEKSQRLAFCGDIYINLHALTAEQAEYNQYAPILMTSVDTDPALCKIERAALLSLLDQGKWLLFGSHGGVKEHTVPGQKN